MKREDNKNQTMTTQDIKKQTMRQTIRRIIPAAAVLLLIAALVFPAAAAELSAEAPSWTFQNGDTITIPVSLKNDLNFVGFSAKVNNNIAGVTVTIGDAQPISGALYQINSNGGKSEQWINAAFFSAPLVNTGISDETIHLFDINVTINDASVTEVPVEVTLAELYAVDGSGNLKSVSTEGSKEILIRNIDPDAGLIISVDLPEIVHPGETVTGTVYTQNFNESAKKFRSYEITLLENSLFGLAINESDYLNLGFSSVSSTFASSGYVKDNKWYTISNDPQKMFSFTITIPSNADDGTKYSVCLVPSRTQLLTYDIHYDETGSSYNTDHGLVPGCVLRYVNSTVTVEVVGGHTVTVTSSAGGSAVSSPKVAAAGTSVTLSAVPDSGFIFKEWQVLSGGVSVVNDRFSMPNRDVEIYAVFEKAPFNAVYAASVVNQTIPSGLSALTVPLFTNQKSGKSIPLNDSVTVTAVIGGTKQVLPATIVDGHVVLDNPSAVSGASGVTVVFFGRKLGDADGDGNVSVNDAVRVAQFLVNIVTMDAKGVFYGDTDGDGGITVNDAVKVAQRIVGLVNENYE